MLGFDLSPDDLRLLEETQTPAQQATLPPSFGTGEALLRPGPEPLRSDVPTEATMAPQTAPDADLTPSVAVPRVAPTVTPGADPRAVQSLLRTSPEAPPASPVATGVENQLESGARGATSALRTDAVTDEPTRSPSLGGTGGQLSILGFDASGSAVADIPQVGRVIVPPTGTAAWGEAAVQRFLATGANDASDPNNPALDPDTVSVLLTRAAAEAGGLPAGPTGPVEPRMEAELQQQIRTPGTITPETAMALGIAQLGTAQARGDQRAADLATAAFQEEAGAQMAAEQKAAAAQQAARAEAVRQRLEQRIQGMEQRIRDVAEMRVDPNAAFGGAGGRLGAAVAVAFGQMGAAIGGGENAALAIINNTIEQSMRAQEANIRNAQAGVANEGRILNQMRAILGDEEAAQSASRAAHLAAVQTRLQGMMAGLQGERLMAAQRLQSALQQEMLLAQQAAAERAATATEAELTTSFRGPESQVRGAIGRAMTVNAPGAPAPASSSPAAPAQDAPRITTAGPISEDDPDVQALFSLSDDILGEEGAERARRLRNDAFRARARGNREGAETIENGIRGSARARRAAAARNIIRRSRGPNEFEAARDAFSERHPARLRPLVIFDRDENGFIRTGAEQIYQQAMDSENGPARLAQILSFARVLDRWTPDIIAANNQFRAELTNADAAVAEARTLRNMLVIQFGRAMSGAQIAERELERFEALFPDPNAISVENLTEFWGAFQNTWMAIRRGVADNTNAQLSTEFGLQLDNHEIFQPAQRALLERSFRETQERLRNQQPSLLDRAGDVAGRLFGNIPVAGEAFNLGRAINRARE